MQSNSMERKAYNLGFHLSRCSLAMRGHVNRLLKDAGFAEVSMGFVGVLMTLYEEDGRTISAVGEKVSLEKSTMTGLIDRMAKAGLITRETDQTDRRVLRVWLTARGREVQTGIARVLAASYKELTSGLSAREIEHVESALLRVIANANGQK
jgi:MarR family transcriptional regulator, organic hydroperoxide resistance regulator